MKRKPKIQNQRLSRESKPFLPPSTPAEKSFRHWGSGIETRQKECVDDMNVLQCEYDRHVEAEKRAVRELNLLEAITNRPSTSWEQENRIKAATARFLAAMYAERIQDLEQEKAIQKKLLAALALDGPQMQ